MFDFDIANSAFGFVSAIVTALGGTWKFFQLVRERPSKAKLEAARQLAQWDRQAGDASTLRSFGEQQLLRLHFKDLTGIDRAKDHAALLRAHAKLGGTDYDWRRLRYVAAYLERSGEDVVVRCLRGPDYVLAALSSLLVFMGAMSAWFFVDGMNQVASSGKGTPAGKLFALLVLGAFAVGVLVIAVLFLAVLLHMFVTARDVRKELAATRSRVTLDDLQLVSRQGTDSETAKLSEPSARG